MASVDEIQALIDDARRKISNGDFDGVQRVTWPAIRNAINEYPGLSRQGKMQLATLIHGRLDALGLQARNEPVDININKLTEFIQSHLAEPGAQESVPNWFPW